MRTAELDYDLPPDLIATEPAEPRDAARLMVVDRRADHIVHAHVRDLPALNVLRAGDLLVVNRTKVLPAYFEATRAGTGGHITGLFVNEPEPGLWTVMLESRGTLQPGETLTLPDGHGQLRLTQSIGRGQWAARVEAAHPTRDLLDRIGSPPLPPYIRKARRQASKAEISSADRERYNTIFAADPGSIAAPTAGLHFTPQLLKAVEAMGVRRAEVVLDVGLGTFEPVRTDDLAAHPMHAERLFVPAETVAAIRDTRADGGRVIPIGTTTVRALESLPASLDDAAAGFEAQTNLFIYPGSGFEFRFADALMTNFHLPRSTLLALVAALPRVGMDNLRHWYRAAVREGYRFYSYGDAMLLV